MWNEILPPISSIENIQSPKASKKLKTSKKWLSSTKDYLNDFFENTANPGFRYFSESGRSIVEK